MSEAEVSVAKGPKGKRIDIAVMFALCGTLFSLLIFIFMLKQERDASVQQFKMEMTQLAAAFQQQITTELYALDRLQIALGVENESLDNVVEENLAAFIQRRDSLQGAFISGEGAIQVSALKQDSLLQSRFISDYFQRLGPNEQPSLNGFEHEGSALAVASQQLVQGGQISLVMDLNTLLKTSINDEELNGVSGALLAGTEVLMPIGSADELSEAEYVKALRLPLATDWNIRLVASGNRLDSAMSWTPAMFLLTGLLLSFLIASYLKRVRNHLHNLSEQQTVMSEQLVDTAWHDPLTGLVNRIHFDETLDVECRRAVREFSPLTLMLIRVDHYEQYSERYGVQAADILLQQVSESLRSAVGRPGDIIARLDGCLFGLILPSTNEQVVQLAQRCNEIMHQRKIPHEGVDDIDYVTLSIGVATLQPSRMLTPDTLLDQADRQLNNAVEAGGDQYQAYAESTLEPSATYSV
ncbi:diguanylate cyclase [Neptuniibacter caesariensis]|uniref:diguanylate cyclase n=1 Tax=Neptuniibacter caesariensis TaxID=207954 RepID=A0A7U8GTG6_NEPCE|nr:diguanylate cyclase [Neptuniibacter caesariensis]EAR62411.1 hypothetical protein MED92_15278 [Oceanospirillum sp. MED92] [Neptuniibacter caesariensis]